MVGDKIAKLIVSGSLALGILVLVIFLLFTSSPANARRIRLDSVPSTPAANVFTSTQISSDSAGYTNCRFGVGQSRNPVISYDLSSLNAGWYANWGAQANPARPAGIEYVQVLRTSDGAIYGGREHPGPLSYSPSGDKLASIVAANPGALWLVGNEPDCIYQDNVLPENYAEIYHDAYTAIKALDPTAKVLVGNIVQPTPLRLQYLDIVLDTYISRYEEPLPTDGWGIHTYILREASCEVYDHCWGSEIPPGLSADSGEMYDLWEVDALDIFQERILTFRQWMSQHGYRNSPLYISEYGTLWPYYDSPFVTHDGQDVFDETRAGRFMTSTFDFLLTANDPDVGYPADENRLVQRWLWYSLDDMDYGGALFDPYATTPMSLGLAFGDYTAGIPPTVDLFAVEVGQVGPVPFSPTDTATVTLQAQVSNVGNVAITEPITVHFSDAEGHMIGSDRVISNTIAGCAAMRAVTITWPGVEPGAHIVRAVVDPAGEVSESDEANNEVTGIVLVAKKQAFLPVVTRGK